MEFILFKNIILLLLLNSLFFSIQVQAKLTDIIKMVKPSVVGVGIYTPTGRPKNKVFGTGFVIGDGQLIVTNRHVVDQDLDFESMQEIVVFSGTGKNTRTHKAKIIAQSKEYDLAILKITTKGLPALTLATKSFLDEGSDVAFTGFPLGSVLGLYPVTHKAIISAITPTTTPVDDSRQITIKMLKRMRDPYLVYQLDGTAYPGNSGSALYDSDSGEVVGILNKVFVQDTKETVISNPSGITYAIPVKYLYDVLDKNKIAY